MQVLKAEHAVETVVEGVVELGVGKAELEIVEDQFQLFVVLVDLRFFVIAQQSVLGVPSLQVNVFLCALQ